METNSRLPMSGNLGIKKIKAPGPPLSWRIKNYVRWGFIKGWFAYHIAAPIANKFGVMTAVAKLEAVLIRADGTRVRYGILGYRVVTDAFVQFVVDQLQTETSVFGDFKYHDSGEGGTAENATDTDIETTDGESRATGTQTEGSSNQYRSVGTITYSSTKAIVEHGLFNASTGVTLMDRTVFSTINVSSSDAIQFTYTITFGSGS